MEMNILEHVVFISDLRDLQAGTITIKEVEQHIMQFSLDNFEKMLMIDRLRKKARTGKYVEFEDVIYPFVPTDTNH